ncbi:hypothetical protein [Actinoallomurus iriomotensis]|uniref:Uncharacterized protein n=1 Tax=Actinoallomurus iriomotensis TaxID=478107 RepID=A0A9W6RSR5_9ACTN|nr:hypothetical protein [Actinoallomurus iriomotensis]GLY81226.1 hypothetical protein Airi01_094930 [Actinoallomurus iriomotensis]
MTVRPDGPGLSRRRLLGLAGAAGLASGCASRKEGSAAPSPAARGVLAANVNGTLGSVNLAALRDVSATWLRGFFPMPEADRSDPAGQPAIRNLLTAGERGYGTVLSLKFPYNHRPLPSPGGSAMNTELGRLDRLLPAVMNKVDILAVGNEPFIESRVEDHGRLNAFYQALARHVIDHRNRHFGARCRTRIYMGALNHLERPAWRTPATDRWMEFVRGTPAVDGVDIHPHLPAPQAGRAYLDYVLPRMRADQSFLATEFSLVLFWKKHLSDAAPPEFTRRYGMRPGIPVWQVIRQAVARPFPQRKWNDFLLACPWFAENKNFLSDQVTRFRATGRLAVAAYGMAQDSAMAKDFGPESTPWLLNSLLCPYTVQPDENGKIGENRTWADEFRALQTG